MDAVNGLHVAQLPEEMLKFVAEHCNGPETRFRLGRLIWRGQKIINTPHYVATTSRGAIPHLSGDTVQKHTQISAAYVALEDFIEKSPDKAPIFKTPASNGDSALRQYTGLSSQCLSILGPRRIPSIPCPAHNTNKSISICTSVGFSFLEADQYIEAIERLKPDISTGLVDLVTADKSSVKRLEKSADRTHAWLRDTIDSRKRPVGDALPPLFASVPPLEPEQQSFYLSDLQGDFEPDLSGLCVYSPQTVAALPTALGHLPRLCLSAPETPHTLLTAISLGIDLITTPFVTETSEHGIALSFEFPPPKNADHQALGFDLWSGAHATDLSPLTPACSCYTCTRHHRAYVHHLLQAKEMLAWTLLQIHNHSVIDTFFRKIRESMARGTFEDDVNAFSRVYEAEMPEKTGQGPRVRGYQMKSIGGGEPKRNPKVYGRLDDQVQKLAEAQSGVATLGGDAEELEENGFAKG